VKRLKSDLETFLRLLNIMIVKQKLRGVLKNNPCNRRGDLSEQEGRAAFLRILSTDVKSECNFLGFFKRDLDKSMLKRVSKKEVHI
jgi:hypothetical protein